MDVLVTENLGRLHSNDATTTPLCTGHRASPPRRLGSIYNSFFVT